MMTEEKLQLDHQTSGHREAHMAFDKIKISTARLPAIRASSASSATPMNKRYRALSTWLTERP